jgi:flagellar basal body-associated protein FliL
VGRFNDSKAHYDSLISLFKYVISIIILVITLVGGVIGYLTFTNSQDMREEFRARRNEAKDEIKEIKDEIRNEKVAMQKERESLTLEMRLSINKARKETLEEIDLIKNHASLIAEAEARQKINEVFDKQNLNGFIEELAEQRIKPKIDNLIDRRIVQIKNDEIDKAIEYLRDSKVHNFNIGYLYLQTNSQLELTEYQIKKF